MPGADDRRGCVRMADQRHGALAHRTVCLARTENGDWLALGAVFGWESVGDAVAPASGGVLVSSWDTLVASWWAMSNGGSPCFRCSSPPRWWAVFGWPSGDGARSS